MRRRGRGRRMGREEGSKGEGVRREGGKTCEEGGEG